MKFPFTLIVDTSNFLIGSLAIIFTIFLCVNSKIRKEKMLFNLCCAVFTLFLILFSVTDILALYLKPLCRIVLVIDFAVAILSFIGVWIVINLLWDGDETCKNGLRIIGKKIKTMYEDFQKNKNRI